METGSSNGRRVRFGAFEADLQAGELRKSGIRVRLQDQPFRVLALLLSCSGDVVTREELRAKIWPDDTFVDFDHSLNTAINKIREALGDSASHPRFVETIPRRGYRFLGDVQGPRQAILPTAAGTEPSTQDSSLPAPLPDKVSHLETRLRFLRISLVVSLGLLGLTAAYFLVISSNRQDIVGERPVRKFVFPSSHLRGDVISPNGRYFGYVSAGSVWVQDLEKTDAMRLEATHGAENRRVCWSPDSEFLCYAGEGELRKISLKEQTPIPVCRLSGRHGGFTWSPDGNSIVLAIEGEGLLEVPATGGEPHLFLQSDPSAGEHHFEFPAFLPDGRGLLFTAHMEDGSHPIYSHAIQTGTRVRLAMGSDAGSSPVYSPTGHILYKGPTGDVPSIWALPFSLQRMEPAGEAFPVARRGRFPSVSSDGTLLYAERRDSNFALILRDRKGTKLRELNQRGQGQGLMNRWVSLSPDGRRVAFSKGEGGNRDIWVQDVRSGIASRLTLRPSRDSAPVWAPDGKQLVFRSDRDGHDELFLKSADRPGEEARRLTSSPTHKVPSDWSKSGRYILYTVIPHGNIGYVRRSEEQGAWESVTFLAMDAYERSAVLSPDEKYVAFVSDKSG